MSANIVTKKPDSWLERGVELAIDLTIVLLFGVAGFLSLAAVEVLLL